VLLDPHSRYTSQVSSLAVAFCSLHVACRDSRSSNSSVRSVGNCTCQCSVASQGVDGGGGARNGAAVSIKPSPCRRRWLRLGVSCPPRALYPQYVRQIEFSYQSNPWLQSPSSAGPTWRSPCVRYSWGFVPLDEIGCLGVTKVVVAPEKFVLPSPLWRFDSENQTRSWWSFLVD
jgi:hypothetical protein